MRGSLFYCFLICSALIEYKNISGKTLQESIEGEMSGALEELLVAIGTFNTLTKIWHFVHDITDTCSIYEGNLYWKPFLDQTLVVSLSYHVQATSVPLAVKCVKSVPAYFAERLQESMKVSQWFFFSILMADSENNGDI